MGGHVTLGELEKVILVHIYKYGPDSPWMIARRALGLSGPSPKYDESQVEEACHRLIEAGLLRHYRGPLKGLPTSSIKPWLKVKAKRADRPVKGLYCELTKEGRKLASELYKEFKRQRGTLA
ncbi:MAG: hypothetical protein ACP5FT_03985 [Acidilobus sp.]